MPTARESLLNAARAALDDEPWPGVRMVRVAAGAGVSRQTLYNEFGDKAGLADALVRRQLDAFLRGVDLRLYRAAEAPREEVLDSLGNWIVRAARGDRLVRAALTGCRCDGLPTPPDRPGDLVAELRDRAVAALERRNGASRGDPGTAQRCETTVRLAVSHLVAPAPGPAAPPPERWTATGA
ncbi:TetR/AcrR family transcriptional regulator [Streptomyces sp. SM14]|uniref:TetR/AcrR family transcriptional regulator n=2 Tax=unclassified Streptomyces TaxID=2593676 RepID=UPI000CD4DAA6|nr:TetR/AcrR family transcriptional regulator [Streptomyces sp. SM14]